MRRNCSRLAALCLFLAAGGCGTAVQDGLSAGIEDGVSASITLLVEALTNSLLGRIQN